MSNNNIMRRKFSLREIIMLVVLVVVLFVGLWFMLVYYPVRNRINDIQQQKEELALQNDVAAMRLATYNRMKDAIADIEQTGDETYMHDFGTAEDTKILDDFRDILGRTKDWNVTAQTPVQRDSNVVACAYSFSFGISDVLEPDTAYEKLKSMLTDLMTRDKRRCLMGRLSISPSGGDLENAESITVSGNITFYELGKVA